MVLVVVTMMLSFFIDQEWNKGSALYVEIVVMVTTTRTIKDIHEHTINCLYYLNAVIMVAFKIVCHPLTRIRMLCLNDETASG